MLARYLALLALIAPIVFGDVQFTSPGAGISLTASGATVKISVAWKDSGDDPPLDDLATYSLYLYAGGNAAGTYVCFPRSFTCRLNNNFLSPEADVLRFHSNKLGAL